MIIMWRKPPGQRTLTERKCFIKFSLFFSVFRFRNQKIYRLKWGKVKPHRAFASRQGHKFA